jgi:hypothetical protein
VSTVPEAESDELGRGNAFAIAVRGRSGQRTWARRAGVGLLRLLAALLLVLAVLLPPLLGAGLLWGGVRRLQTGMTLAGAIVVLLYATTLRATVRRALAERRTERAGTPGQR